jgi:hypothetical protein
MILLFLGVLFVPFFSKLFALSLGAERYSLVAIVVGLVGAGCIWVMTIITDRWRR